MRGALLGTLVWLAALGAPAFADAKPPGDTEAFGNLDPASKDSKPADAKPKDPPKAAEEPVPRTAKSYDIPAAAIACSTPDIKVGMGYRDALGVAFRRGFGPPRYPFLGTREKPIRCDRQECLATLVDAEGVRLLIETYGGRRVDAYHVECRDRHFFDADYGISRPIPVFREAGAGAGKQSTKRDVVAPPDPGFFLPNVGNPRAWSNGRGFGDHRGGYGRGNGYGRGYGARGASRFGYGRQRRYASRPLVAGGRRRLR